MADLPPVLEVTPEPLEQLWQALVLATRDYVHNNRFTDICLGLSGGVDSTLVACIAAEALGPEHVHAVLMPSRFSSDHSVSDAEKLSRKEEKRKAKVATDARNEFLARIQVAVETGKMPPKELWRLVCLGCIERAWSDTSKDVGKRREVEVESQAGYVYQKALNAFAMGENQASNALPTSGQLASMALELVLSPCVFGFSNQQIVKVAEKILGTKMATITKRLDKASKKKAVKK